MRITTLILFHTCRNLPLRVCEPIVHSSSGNNRVTEALLLVPPAPKHTGHGIGFSFKSTRCRLGIRTAMTPFSFS